MVYCLKVSVMQEKHLTTITTIRPSPPPIMGHGVRQDHTKKI